MEIKLNSENLMRAIDSLPISILTGSGRASAFRQLAAASGTNYNASFALIASCFSYGYMIGKHDERQRRRGQNEK